MNNMFFYKFFFEPSNGFSWHRLLRRTLVLSILFGTVFSSCQEKKRPTEISTNKDVYYTCSMHPQVMENNPGNCPICGMKLIAVPKSSTSTSTQVQLSAEQIQLGNVRVDTINTESIGNKTILTGTLNFDQNSLSSVSAPIEGRIERLYFKNSGDYIHKGDKLYDIYSEQLNNEKQQYITALQQQKTIGNSLINYGALIESAKHKLLLWGMTNEQINQLEQNKQPSTLTSFYSTEEGYITNIGVKEGDYVMEGSAVVQLANLSTLWAEAQVYTTQIASVNTIENVTVQIPDLNDKIINGKIDFVNPEINPDMRINLVRVKIPNNNNELHPGMLVYIVTRNSVHHSIVLPVDAVLTDSKGSVVWVETKPGIYEVRMVQTGIESGNFLEIKSGLREGDIVVTSGAYLINSEYIFEHGSNPMAGMDMSGMKM